jgi:hypothetical protein
MPTLNISKFNNISSSLSIIKAKQKNTLIDKIQQTRIKMSPYSQYKHLLLYYIVATNISHYSKYISLKQKCNIANSLLSN